MATRVVSKADEDVKKCLAQGRSFALIAGAGSGKTTSLIDALLLVREGQGTVLRRNGQRVACITYTRRAVEVIKSRLSFDELYLVSTLHSFLWGELSRFHDDIREALREHRIPSLIAKASEKDKGGKSKTALKARQQVADLTAHLENLDNVPAFEYGDAPYSDYSKGIISHDDIVEVASYLLANKLTLRRLIGQRFPYIFVDEAQDTAEGIVSGLNLASTAGSPLVGYFGDPWQQIYEGSAGTFAPAEAGLTITKTENFRCSANVVKFLNVVRQDVKQYPAGDNAKRPGSVILRLIKAEAPELPRGRYSEEQVDRALARMDQTMGDWGWNDNAKVIRLFLVRQMIARRLGFPNLNRLFTGDYASHRSQESYEKGEHFLLKPFLDLVNPVVLAHAAKDGRGLIDLLRKHSPAFAVDGPNQKRSLREMIDRSNAVVTKLVGLWEGGTVRAILEFCRTEKLAVLSDRLLENLDRAPRTEEYDEDQHAIEKGDWLCDDFFKMTAQELAAYCSFVSKNTAYSTQHGVKGEQYEDVLVVFDDVEAAWSQYSFTKLLTPATAGDPTAGQLERSKKLAYVCFSRAMDNLRVILYTPDPEAARQELIDRKFLAAGDIQVVQ